MRENGVSVGAGMEGLGWKRFMRKHWGIVPIFLAAGVVAFVGAIYVFLWFVGNAQSSGLVPAILSQWTMGNLLEFVLNAVFWELLIIGIPGVVAVVIGWQWWKRLPDGERAGPWFGRRSRTRGRSGGLSLFFFIAFAIKVYLDGNWNVPIANFTLNYVVGSMVLILIWTAVIVGIPLAAVAVWWIRREMKKP